MDERQQKQVNEAAKKFAQSLTEAYRSVAGRSVSAQELNAQLTPGVLQRRDQQP
jgi:hypothetical protein